MELNLYDRDRDYRDVPPYHHHLYKSIYEGIVVEIQIVDHCNLNCAFCNHFSPIAEPWCITVDSFKSQIELLSINIPNVKRLILIGGEPTLHPQLLELCKIAHNIMPEVIIEIFTNGIKLAYLEPIGEELKSLNTFISFSSYPGHYDLKRTDNFLLENPNSGYTNTRILMAQSLVNECGNEDSDYNYFNCSHHNLPCFTLKDFKLYICPFAAHSIHYFTKANLQFPDSEKNYLLLSDIAGDLNKIQDFIFTSKPICAYCKHDGGSAVWQKSYRDLIEYNTTLYDLYFKDYKRYESIVNSGKEYLENCFNENKNHAVMRVNDCGPHLTQIQKRYGQGKLDLIIPYYNVPMNFLVRLYNSLVNQTIIEDCVIYLISDNSENERDVMNLFLSGNKLNCVFLKTDTRGGPGVARNKGLENSYNDYILMFDADDYFIDNKGLEILYDGIIKKQSLVLHFAMPQDNHKDNPNFYHKGNLIFHRDIITKYNVRFKPIFICEDYLFIEYLNYIAPAQQAIEENRKYSNLAVYGLKDNTTNLSSTCATGPYKMEFAILSSRFLLYQDLRKFDNTNNLYESIISTIYEQYATARSVDIKAIAYILLYNIYKNNPELFTEDTVDWLLLSNFVNNNHNFTTANKILLSYDEILLYVKQILNKVYGNSLYFKNAAELVLSYLN